MQACGDVVAIHHIPRCGERDICAFDLSDIKVTRTLINGNIACCGDIDHFIFSVGYGDVSTT